MTDALDLVSAQAREAERIGGPDQVLTTDEVRKFVLRVLGAADLDGRSVCLVIPDGTRSAPSRCSCSACTRP